MNIHDILKQIAEQELAVKPAGTNIAEPIASGSAPGDKAGARTLDDGQTLDAKQGTDDHDPVKSGSAPGAKSGSRSADNGDSLPAKQGTEIGDPVSHVTQGRGTEVQGNTGVMEDIEADIDSIIEAWTDGATKRTPEENKAALRASLKASVEKAGAKNKERNKAWTKEKEVEEACSQYKAKMKKEIKEALDEKSSYEVTVSEEMTAVIAGAGLTEDVAQQAADVFKATISAVLKEHIEMVNEYAAEVVSEAFDTTVSEMQESVDGYLATAVAEWKEENKLAIEVGVRTKIAESLMEGLTELLKEHAVEVPEDKEDLYETAIAEGEKLVEDLADAKEEIAQLQEKIAAMAKASVVESVVVGLVDTQAEKLRKLAEEIEFSDEFEAKLRSIKESITVTASAAPAATLVVEDTDVSQLEEEAQPVVQDEIGKLASQIGRLTKRF